MVVLASLPAAAMLRMPLVCRLSKVFCSVMLLAPPPSDMLITLAPAAAHLLAAEDRVEEYAQPSLPNTFTMCSLRFLFGFTPTTPVPLLTPAMVPNTWVPWWFSSVFQLPVPASYSPVTLAPLADRSSCWKSTPESMMQTLRLPALVSGSWSACTSLMP
jgi:hypothetical protein